MSVDAYRIAGPVLFLAGPGTGKTYQLGKRIKCLVKDENVSPDEITVITFTTAAAKNMRDRISDDSRKDLYIEPAAQPKSIRTMHSLGYMILQDDQARVPFSCNNVVTSFDQQQVLCEDAAQLAGFERSMAEAALRSRQRGDHSPVNNEILLICRQYEQVLRACSAIDYDDQIFLACQALKSNQDLLRKYQLQCRHLLVDEYQDINAAQFELIKLLCDPHPAGIFVVGDDDQSIYSWRGGSPEFIRRFKDDFGPSANIIPLQKSFRCHKNILEGATCVVSQFDHNRLEKGPFTYDVEDGPKIQIHSAPSDDREAKIVCSIVQQALPSRDVLVLVPHRGFAKAIVKALVSAKIPYSSQQEIPGEGLRAIAALGRWLKDQSDSLSLRICLEQSLSDHKEVPSRQVRKPERRRQRDDMLDAFSGLWRSVIEGTRNSLWDSLQTSHSTNTLLTEALTSLSEILALSHTKKIADFAAKAFDSLRMWKEPWSFLDEAQEWVSFFERSSSQGQGANVRIMTFQSAKGLQAKVVCVLGLEEGTLPRKGSDDERRAEEARLFYVSATRAIEELHLFHARKRSSNIVYRDIYQGAGPPDLQPSRFLAQIHKDYKESKYHPA